MIMLQHVIVVDDEPKAREFLCNKLKKRHLDFVVAGTASNTKMAWDLVKEMDNIDGVFLDIDIDSETERAGLDFARNLKAMAFKGWIVFVSGKTEHALEAYHAFPVSFLPKPFSDEDLERTLNEIRLRHPAQTHQKHLAIRHRIIDSIGEKTFCTEYVDPDEILYVQKNNGVNSVQIGLLNGDILDGVNSALKDWEDYGFFQIHRRNLVNLHYVRRELPRVGENNVYKLGFKGSSIELDIGPDYLESLHERLKQLLGQFKKP